MEAVRVPPSACSTSQSSVTVRLAERGRVCDGSQTSADQALYLVRATRRAAPPRFARRALLCGARQHGIFRRDPATATIAQKRRHALFDRSCADDSAAPISIKADPSGVRQEIRCDAHHSQLVCCAPVSACEAHHAPRLLRPPEWKARFPKISRRRG